MSHDNELLFSPANRDWTQAGQLYSNMYCPVDPTEEPKGSLPDSESARAVLFSADAKALGRGIIYQPVQPVQPFSLSCCAHSAVVLAAVETTAEVLAVLKQHQQGTDQPKFLAVGFHKPHIPFKFPAKYLDLVPSEAVRSLGANLCAGGLCAPKEMRCRWIRQG